MSARRILLGVTLFVGFAVAVVVGVGYSLPVAHVATVKASYRQPRDTIWRSITTPGKFPDWRPDVREVVIVTDAGGATKWKEIGSNGEIPFVVLESHAPQKLVTRIDSTELPFGGTWTYVVTTDGAGATTLSITEEGEVYNPVFRYMSKYVFGHTATIEGYLNALGKKLNEDVSPVVVENR